MKIIKKTELYYREGSSDKVYIATIQQDGSYYSVPCEYGRRGSDLRLAHKGNFTNLGDANRAFDKVVAEKVAKGYRIKEEVVVDKVVSAPVVEEEVFHDEVLVCEDSAREKALARLKASSVW